VKFASEKSTIKEAIQDNKANLYEANLSGQTFARQTFPGRPSQGKLYEANLYGANLSGQTSQAELQNAKSTARWRDKNKKSQVDDFFKHLDNR